MTVEGIKQLSIAVTLLYKSGSFFLTGENLLFLKKSLS
jgi:hypothetical protein